MQDWSTKNQWTWTSAPADAGSYSVYVYARDGMHAPATGYDSALGQSFALSLPPTRSLATGSLAGAMPSLVFTGDGYLLAFQSAELGVANQGDVALQKLDPAWNKQKSVWVASSKANESAPSLISSGGYYYVAYASAEKGSRDIFVKKYDSNLKLLDTKQLTSLAHQRGFAVADCRWQQLPIWPTSPGARAQTAEETYSSIGTTRTGSCWEPSS